jgi:hypothetical protein
MQAVDFREEIDGPASNTGHPKYAGANYRARPEEPLHVRLLPTNGHPSTVEERSLGPKSITHYALRCGADPERT